MSEELKNRIMRKKEVMGLVGVSDPTLWRWEREGTFPRRRRLGGNSVGWFADEIAAFLETIRTQTDTPASCNGLNRE